MDKHKALIEKIAGAIYKAQGGSFEVIGAKSMVPAATAALNAVYEALKEPSARLNSALCQFTNCATDDFEPVDDWNKETWANFEELCQAYNAAHEAGLFALSASALQEGE